MHQLGELADRVGAEIEHGEVGLRVAMLRHGEGEFHAAAGDVAGAFLQAGAEGADIGETALALGRHDENVDRGAGLAGVAGPAVIVGKGDVRIAEMAREMELNFVPKFFARKGRF